MVNCLTCQFLAERNLGARPLWDDIYRAPYWDVVHSYNTSLPGWLVLVARRHIAAIHDVTEDEAVELGRLQRQVSMALEQVTGCVKTYVIQFAEAAEHPHVHFHIIPRMADLPADHRGPNIFKYLGVSASERVSEAEMTKIAAQVRDYLLAAQID